MNDQARRLRELARERVLPPREVHSSGRAWEGRRPRTISITSGKGGVGKSNIALYLATAFALMRKRVLLFDADFGLANIHLLLGIAPRLSLADAVGEKCSLDEILTTVAPGFDILPGASGIERMANLEPARLALLQREFGKLEERYELVLVDTGAGIGVTVTQLASKGDLALVVATPEPTSLADAYAMIKVLFERGAFRVGVAVNMCSSDREGTEIFDKLNALVIRFLQRNIEFTGAIPYCREVGSFVRKQRSLLLEKRDSPFARHIGELARRLCGIPAPVRCGFFERLWGPPGGQALR